MEIFLDVLILLVLVGASNILNRFVPFIPIPLIQIGLGVLAAVLPPGMNIPLSPELFFLLFVAPLLFNDGKRTSREALWELRLPILLLALGLVFVTVFAAGAVIHGMVPSVPWPAAFALAAILSPTDAVAVGSLAGRIQLPKKIMHLLEGEALMNDASGLVAFKFAIASMVTGVFSITNATFSFIVIAAGGLLSGIVISYLLIWMRIAMRRLGIEDVTVHMLVLILTPFLIYLGAEELGVSGILAVVAGGIIHAIEREGTQSLLVKLQIVSDSTWSVILFILNGLVFVILGLQLPRVTLAIAESGRFGLWEVLGYVAVISISLILLRFIWVYLFSGRAWAFGKNGRDDQLRMKAVVLTSLSGVRGAITLAGALSIPFVLQDGSPFPERDLLIVLSAGVILFTLITASVMLPLLTKKKDGEKEQHPDDLERVAWIKVMEAAVKMLHEEIDEENQAAALSVISEYNGRIKQALKPITADRLKHHGEITRIRILAIEAQRNEVQRMLQNGEIRPELAYRFQEFFSKTESLISNRWFFRVLKIVYRIRWLMAKVFKRKHNMVQKILSGEQIQLIKKVKLQTAEAAIEAVERQMSEENKSISLLVIAYYQQGIVKQRSQDIVRQEDEKFKEQQLEMELIALQGARNEIQSLFERGEITRPIAFNLRQQVNYLEAGLLKEEE